MNNSQPTRSCSNVADLLTQSAARWPDAQAVIHEKGALTYAQLERTVWALCGRLQSKGLVPGDVVGIHVQSSCLHLVWLMALARCGMPSLAVQPSNESSARNALFVRTGASAVVTDRLFNSRRYKRIDATDVLAEPASEGTEPPWQCRDPSRIFIFKSSSGTMGKPKLVANTHADMLMSIEREQLAIGYPSGERYMTPVDMSHDGPRRRLLACLASGGTLVLLPPRAQPRKWVEWMERFDVRHFSCVPSQAYQLAMAMMGRPRFDKLRSLRISAGPSDLSLHKLLRERVTPNVLVSYGCTEIGPMSVAAPALLAKLPETVGVAMPGVEIELVDANDQPVPAGTVGEVRIRTLDMPSAYHDDPDASAKAFRSGWFYPGDTGQFDASGHLFHLGRADDMMVFNGINISPSEIERALLSHPAILDAVAMPLKRPIVNDIPVCAVSLVDGMRASVDELLIWCRKRIGVRSPTMIQIMASIPRNAMGKPLREKILEAMGSGANGPAPKVTVRLGQLKQKVKLAFTMPESFDASRIEAWLDLLAGSAQGRVKAHDVPYKPRSKAESAAAQILGYDLAMAFALMHALGVPMFDDPVVEDLTESPEGIRQWVAKVMLPLIEGLPPGFLEQVFKEAALLRLWASNHPVDELQTQHFFNLIQQNVLAKLGKTWRAGKSTLPVLRSAWEASIPFMHLSGGVFQLGWGSKAQRIFKSITSEDRAIGANLSTDKALAASLMRRAGLPAPDHHVVTALPAALAAAHRLGWPVVVKPLDRERGEGVNVDITNQSALTQAFEAAYKISPRREVLVERQAAGVCHRLFIAQSRLLYAVKRLPMSIRGDGIHTIEALVAQELRAQKRLPPWKRSGIAALDDMAKATFSRLGYTESSVPSVGQLIPLRPIETSAWGGVDEDVTRHVHPENLRIALAAAELFGLDMAGVDIISPDIAQPWYANKAILNEVNFSPLLGGGEISRSHLPAFMASFVKDMGRIPMEVFVGGRAAWSAATARWQAMREQGLNVWLTDAKRTWNGAGHDTRSTHLGLYRRARALLISGQVDAMVMVVSDNEFLATGLPMEAVDSVVFIDRDLNTLDGQSKLSAPAADALQNLLRSWPEHSRR
jgi:cyanophycin synthetase